ncbi:MAG TPA: hypothetical protein VEU62_18785 [Bryobacterales bacterium]|nr:hypothetical protein [Bryobacterales bacterium]
MLPPNTQNIVDARVQAVVTKKRVLAGGEMFNIELHSEATLLHTEIVRKEIKQMRAYNAITTAFCLGLLCAALPGPARADEWNKKTNVSFSQPVEIPGMVLPAGQYVFKLADSQSNRDIVQVFNKDENHIYKTILAIPDYRLQPADKTVITFEERAAGAPRAVKEWFYPGDNYGEEFVYPRVKKVMVAEASKPAPPAPMAPQPAPATADSAPAQPKPVEVAQASKPAPPPAPAQSAPAPSSKRLPATASSTPLLGLLGLCSLGVAAGLRALSRRVA